MSTRMSDLETGKLIRSAAETYEQFFVPALFQEWPTRVLDAAAVASSDRVLDVACGTGVLAREAAERTETVVGIDLNEDMLAVARRKTPNVQWRQGNAEALPFEDDNFDAVVSQFGLMFFENKITAISEMLRVLRPGGRLAVATWDSIDHAPGYAAMKDLAVQLFGEELVSGFDAPFILGDRKTLCSIFEEAGVSNPQISTQEGTARYPSIQDWVYTDIKGWTLAGVLDDDQFDLLLREAKSTLSRFVRPDGSVAFTAPAHIVCATKM